MAGVGKNPSWLAKRVGVDRSTITRITQGDRKPKLDTLQQIATALSTNLLDLVAGTDAECLVNAASDLVSRKHLDEANQYVVALERQKNDLVARVRTLEAERDDALTRAREYKEELRTTNDSFRKCEEDRRRLERERDHAKGEVARERQTAERYLHALQEAMSDVAKFQAQITELGEAVEAGKRTGRVAAILAGAAAIVSLATYLKGNGGQNEAA